MGEIDKIMAEVSPFYRKKDGSPKGPSEQFEVVYDSSSETLEPVYFWVLDKMNTECGTVEKIFDNFASSPGSGHFSELRGKASQMQEQASRVLGTVNNILKGILNLIYDLKEFKLRLSHYDAAKSSDKEKSQAGLLALKQIWMDKVDIQRGQGSINAMTAGDLNFVTLRDAFLTAKSLDDLKDIDLNERVKRVLKPRLQEFFEWQKRSEQELKKRFEIEKTYLKSQVDALKLNTRWARPYLRAAEQLHEKEGLQRNPAVVTAFNTVLIEVCLMGINKVNVDNAVYDGNLPESFQKMKNLRTYRSLVFVDFLFRGIPSKAGQHYVFGGRAEARFKAYALNDEEFDLFKAKLDESDLEVAFNLVEGMTTDSLAQLKLDLDEILGDDKEKNDQDINPFVDIGDVFGSLFKSKKKSEKDDKKERLKKLKEKGPRPESWAEKYLRNLTVANAKSKAYLIYDLYKKQHGMASFPFGGLTYSSSPPRSAAERAFNFK